MNTLGSAIAPNIFDSFLDTGVLLPLVLGNLLSQNLWDFSARIQAKLAAEASEVGADEDPLKHIKAIQRQLDRHFKHLHPSEVAKICGELDLCDERRRLGPASVDRALETIEATFQQRLSTGSIPREAIEPLLTRIKLGYFPAFFYTNVDVVLANKRLLGRKSSAPLGLTSCLDEVAIFTALAMTMPGGDVANVIALTSASHYTAFGWTHTGQAWWFYGKNKLFCRQDWDELVSQQFDGHPQQAFDFYFKDMARIVCVTGSFDLVTGESAISTEHMTEIIEQLDRFFGVRLSQLSVGRSKPNQTKEGSVFAPVLRELLEAQSLERTRLHLLDQLDPHLLPVLYSYRTLALQDLRPYLWVARHQTLCLALGRALKSRQDAIDIVKNITGSTSIFKDRNRIAMPDETLRLKTGSDRDKALLLHVLLEHLNAITSVSLRVETLFSAEDSFVCVDSFCFSTKTFAEVARPICGVIAQFTGDIVS
jgi:hypothetical protein